MISVIETKKKTKLPGIVGCNLIWLAYQEFIKKHPVEVFYSLQYPQNVELWSVRSKKVIVYTKTITINVNGEVVYKNTHQNCNHLLDGPVGTVKIGMDKEPICIPGNAMLTVPGNTSKIYKGQSYIVEQAAHHNLPHIFVVNSCCCVMPKARWVPVILRNTTDQNIWVRQPFLPTELFEVEVESQ